MEYMNVVRMTVRPGSMEEWTRRQEASRDEARGLKGLLDIRWLRTGDRSVCVVGRWESEEALAAARPWMIQQLDSVRELLEPLSDALGVTDPVSGPVFISLD